jgi:hypothetical protein
MAVLTPIEVFEISDFREFCAKFDLNSKYVAGNDGTDEELIILELNKILKKKFVLNFIEDKTDGHFKIQVFE